jgi:3-oxoadipate enol-lactonase
VRYDCRGHGASDVAHGATALERLGGDLVALLDALAIARAHVCGLSLGGITAMWAAVHHPARIGRAMFANTAARLGTREQWDARIATVRAGGMAALRETVVGRFLSAPFRAAHPDVASRIGDMVEGTPPEGYVAACHALREADLRDVVGRIRAPSLVITSEWDESTPPAQGAALHAAIPGSELAEIARAAHLSNVEQPEAFISLVTRFLGVP